MSETGTTLEAIAAGEEWRNLDAATQARVLRLRASVCLALDDEAGARCLADEADALSAAEEPRLRAFLAYRRDGADAALRILGEPTTQDGAHLKASLLLDQGDADVALMILDGHPALRPDDPETLRLRSLAALIVNDRSAALRYADAALAAAPERLEVRWMWAVARYAFALSPAVGPDRFLVPNPAALDLVREDDDARARLLEALGAFEAMAARDIPPGARRDSEVFALACLCNLRDRTSDAANRVDELLRREPAWAAVANWALARGFPIDTAVLSKALKKRLSADEGQPEQVLLLATMAEMNEGATAALTLIHRWSAVFDVSAGMRDLREAWLAGLNSRVSDGTDPTRDKDPDPADLNVLINDAAASDDWTLIERLLDQLASGIGQPAMALLPVAQVLAGKSRWEAVGRHRDRLTALGTPEAIRIAAHAAFRTGCPGDALKLLQAHRSAFAGARLPRDLQRLEIEALTLVGDQASAVRMATAAANAADATPQDALAAAVAHLRTGNIAAAVPYVQAVGKSAALLPRDALALAREVAIADPRVAAVLWRQAVSTGPDPALVPHAVDLAFRLGLEQEAAPLLGMLGPLSAQEGTGVQAVDLDSLLQLTNEHREVGEQVVRLHLDGHIPAHLAAVHTGRNLADLFRISVSPDAARGMEPLLMVHGVRSQVPSEPWRVGAGPLHVDITALLIADQLDLLEALEGLPGGMLLPPSLPTALVELERQLRHHQPRQVEATRTVHALVTSGAIAQRDERDAAPEGVAGEPGAPRWLVGFTPLDGIEEEGATSLPTRTSPANPRALVDTLLRSGHLNPGRHAEALAALGQYGASPAVGFPRAGERLLLANGIATLLAGAGVLTEVTAAFRASISDQDVRLAGVEVAELERRTRDADRLATLRTWVARVLTNGTFATLPADGEINTAFDSLGPVVACLAELLRAPGKAGGATWVDDRHINGHALCGANTVVSTPEVLCGLAEAGLITADARWSAMLRLRAAGALFLPLGTEEVLHHLLAAPVVDGELVETPALTTLRRYVALAIARAGHLDVSPVLAGTGRGEVPFLLSLRRLAGDTVLGVWLAEGRDDSDRKLRTDWTWAALLVERLPDVGLPGTAPESWHMMPAFHYAGLLANGLQIATGKTRPESQTRLQAYMRWTEDTTMPAWMWEEEVFVQSVTSCVANLFAGLLEKETLPPDRTLNARRYIQGVIGNAVAAMPKRVQVALLADAGFCKKAGIKLRAVMVFGGFEFNPDEFWKACAKALRGQRATVTAVDGRSVVRMQRSSVQLGQVELSGVLKGTISDPALGLLASDRATRARAANEIAGTLRLDATETAAAVAEITLPTQAANRMDVAVRLRQSSPAVRLTQLRDALQQPERIPLSDFDPGDTASLLRHLGLTPGADTPIAVRVAGAAEKLLRDFGPSEAIQRLSSLPIPLPANLLDAACGLSLLELKLLLAGLCGHSAGPLQHLHGLRLHRATLEAGCGNGLDFSRSMETLAERWKTDARLLITLLRRFVAGFRPWPGRRAVLRPDEALVLSWAHADRIAGTLVGAGHNPEWAAQFFSSQPAPASVDSAIVFSPGYDDAAATPTSMTVEALLFHGLGYALGEEPPRSAATPAAAMVDRFRALLSVQAKTGAVPVPWLYADRGGARDDLGTWFGLRPTWLFAPGTDVSQAGALELLGSAFADLRAARADEAVLWVVLAIVSQPHLDEQRCALAALALEVADLAAIVRADRRAGFDAFRAAAAIAQAARSALSVERLEAQILVVARDLSATSPSGTPADDEVEETVTQILEVAVILARAIEVSVAWQRFGTVVIRIADAWPQAVPTLRRVVGALATTAHPEGSKGLWDAWMQFRARR